MKKILLLTLIVFTISGCQFENISSKTSNNIKQSTNSINNSYVSISESKTSSTTVSTSTGENKVVDINLALNTTVTNSNGGVIIDEQIITINKAGTYRLQGTLDNGSVVINVNKEEKVNLILNDVNITSLVNSPLYCLSADKLIIELASNTTNILTDASEYVYENEEKKEPNACLFSKDDLTIKGDGSLIVNANFNNGIGTKDDLKISNGQIVVNAPNNAIKGNDSIKIKGGNIKVTSTDGDGLKTDNEEDEEKGYIEISAGILDITAKYDGIQSSNYINIDGGDITVKTNNGANGSISSSDTNSYKGIKAINDININGGNINVDSLDDSIHSNKNIVINDGECILSSGDDGIHADENLHITGGKINVLKSYEGLESAKITIDDGNIEIYSSDDGVNVAGGDGSNDEWRPGGGPGGHGGWWRNNQTLSTSTADYVLTINGGYLFVNASGDGLDSNGDIYINGGIIIVNGPTSNGDGALDYGDNNAKFEINGGTLIAVGSSGMAVGPTNGSTQYSAKITLPTSNYSLVAILNQNGEAVIAFAAEKKFSSMVVSHADFNVDETYTISINGSYEGGSSIGGLYFGGTYVGGTVKSTFKFSSKTTNVTIR